MLTLQYICLAGAATMWLHKLKQVLHSNCKLVRESLLWRSLACRGCLPDANLATIHSAVCDSHPALACFVKDS